MKTQRIFLFLTLSLAATSFTSCANRISKKDSEFLEQGFATPPDDAKPRVWWHWMNGNITKDGALKDIEWMHRVGIGGFHCFDAGLETPLIVDHKIAYMSDEWKDVFSSAVAKADEYGMEVGIAASPGWSETGGPWVKPENAMKKIVWSEADAEGGKTFDAILPHPPANNGKFQDILDWEASTTEQYYDDIAVLAVRVKAPSMASLNPVLTSSSGSFNLEQLTNGKMDDAVLLPYSAQDQGAWLAYEFDTPKTVYGADIAGGIYNQFVQRVIVQCDEGTVLEYSDDGVNYTAVSPVTDKAFNVATLSFEPVTAKYFRVSFAPQLNAVCGYYNEAMHRGIGVPPPTATGVPVSEFNLYLTPRVSRYIEKAGFFPAKPLYDSPSHGDNSPTEVIDISDKMSPDGHLCWTPAEGCWKILRFGYSLTGRMNCPASPEATGLEVDKLDPEAVRHYMEHYLAMYKDASSGLMGERGIHYIMFDSWEACCLNWTPKMFEYFKELNGYELMHWLPAIAGYVVDSPESSDKFLWDYRNTIAEMTARNHYDLLTEVLAKHGLERYSESQELARAFIADGMRVKKNAAIPMCAMWTGDPNNIMGIGTSGADCRESASVAHLYGKKYVSAEALTAAGNAWSSCPATLKERADLLMANGLNRFIIHESAHQPLDDFRPGFTLSHFGQWFNRHETWAEYAGDWMNYLSRSCFMLQQGRYVADVLYFYGEDNNLTLLYRDSLPEIPDGYNFDFINADGVINDLKVRGGKIVSPSGNAYSVIALGENARVMSLSVLRALEKLVNKGAVLVGTKPEYSPSLVDDPEEFALTADRLWSSPRVYTGTIQEALDAIGCPKDVTVSRPSATSDYKTVHRDFNGIQIYWIDSRSRNEEDVEATFNVCGLTPEIWNAVDGSIRPASYRTKNMQTIVKLHFGPEDALFVVFRKKTKVEMLDQPEEKIDSMAVNGPWKVSFNNGMGAPESIEMDSLADWSLNGDIYIRYYSGAATYSKNVNIPSVPKDSRIVLNLGNVANLAAVKVNGQDFGTVWREPWKVDITPAVKEGENSLEITVVNLWLNRLIGDERGDAGRYGHCAMIQHNANEPLQPSGLLGPVSIETATY